MKEKKQNEPVEQGRVIGLDLHPDLFSAAALEGLEAGSARVVAQWDQLATSKLEKWAQGLKAQDVVVLEASGNSFEAAQDLHRLGLKVLVLESQQASKVRTNYCNNDRVSAVKLARVYLSGLAKIVWQPDAKTRERRELLHAHRKSVATTTRTKNRLKAFLNEHRVRLKPGMRLTQPNAAKMLLASYAWSPLQKLLLEEMLGELQTAEARRKRLSAMMAQEVASDPQLLTLMRLMGVRHIIAFAIAAVVGDITRFANPKKLVAYLGLAPNVDKSGNRERGYEGLTSFGRADLRSLLIQSAQNALNQKNSPLHRWGWKLCLRKPSKNIAVAAIARKLVVSLWYLLRGLSTPLKQIDSTLRVKLIKLATAIGLKTIKDLGYPSRKAFIEEKNAWLLKPT
jgi:transposase